MAVDKFGHLLNSDKYLLKNFEFDYDNIVSKNYLDEKLASFNSNRDATLQSTHQTDVVDFVDKSFLNTQLENLHKTFLKHSSLLLNEADLNNKLTNLENKIIKNPVFLQQLSNSANFVSKEDFNNKLLNIENKILYKPDLIEQLAKLENKIFKNSQHFISDTDLNNKLANLENKILQNSVFTNPLENAANFINKKDLNEKLVKLENKLLPKLDLTEHLVKLETKILENPVFTQFYINETDLNNKLINLEKKILQNPVFQTTNVPIFVNEIDLNKKLLNLENKFIPKLDFAEQLSKLETKILKNPVFNQLPVNVENFITKDYLAERLVEGSILSKPSDEEPKQFVLRGIINYTFNTFINKNQPVEGRPDQYFHSFKIGKMVYTFPITKAKIIHIRSKQGVNFTIKINNTKFPDYTKLLGHILNQKDNFYIYSDRKVEKVYLEMFLLYEIHLKS